MLMSKTWEQTAIYNPNDPTQRIRTVYASPGGWTSYYWNRAPDAGTLQGLGAGFSSLSQPVQIGIVTAVAAVAGYFINRQFGDSHIKPAFARVKRAVGLSGSRRRR